MSPLNILITGSSRGLGRAMALALGRQGHRILVHYQTREKEALAVVDEIRGRGADARALAADVADPAAAARLVDQAVQAGGRLDVLINNAGLTRDRTLLKMSDEEWQQVLNVNLSGTFYCLRAAARHMTAQKDGYILNVSSLVAQRGGFGNANYAAAKAGVIALTKTAARELGRFNVRVNALIPGFHLTDMSAPVWEKRQEDILREHALGRLPTPDELGEFVAALVTQKTVTGQVFSYESRV